jgi:IS605 OrfB family transposase
MQATNPSAPAESFAQSSTTVKAVRAVKFGYTPTQLTGELLATFRAMVNDAVKTCLDEDIRGRLKLRDRVYKEFQERYNVVSSFPYSVAEVAWSIAKKHRRWQRKPWVKRLMLKMESQKYSLIHGILTLPFRRGHRVIIPLDYGNYQRSYLANEELKRGSVTVTEHEVIITFVKVITQRIPGRRIGIDLNEKSAVCSDGVTYDLSEVARLHTEYGIRRSRFSRKHFRDRRLRKNFAGSLREKVRVRQFLHAKAKKIVRIAAERGQGIVLERLRGIRHAHQKGNGEGKDIRRRISQWPFRTFQGYIVHKAMWEGVPVEFVNAAWTSQTCHFCRHVNRNLKRTEREWRCPNCGAILDRDLNAAVNIEARGTIACLGEVRPGAQGMDEAVKGNEQTSAPILRAETLKPTRRYDV